jgi:molybdopterin-guanine dinucleotide biosynthesis protein B/molybdopterin-guanine dinucleotide biosynthesis protein
VIEGTLGAVLAGGRSRRLGRDKALISSRGRTLVGRAVDLLEGLFARVVLVAPGRPEYAALEVERLADRWPDAGPLAGIEAALFSAAGSPVFVLACDLPMVDAELVTSLAAVRPDFGADGPAARLAQADGVLQPLCGLYGAACGPVFTRALERGVRPMHEALLEIFFLERVEVAAERLLNVNVEADVTRLRELEAAWAH